MKKVILTAILFSRKETTKSRKKLDCKFIRINTAKEGYDVDYKASRI